MVLVMLLQNLLEDDDDSIVTLFIKVTLESSYPACQVMVPIVGPMVEPITPCFALRDSLATTIQAKLEVLKPLS